MEPGCVTSPGVVVVVLELLPLPLVPLQAARAVTLATARARTPMCFFPNLVLALFLALAPSVRTGIISLPSFSRRSPVIHCAPAARHWVAIPRYRYGRLPGTTTSARGCACRPGRLAVLELAERNFHICIQVTAEKSQLVINPVTVTTSHLRRRRREPEGARLSGMILITRLLYRT